MQLDAVSNLSLFPTTDIAIMYQHEKFQPGKHRGVITHDIALIKLRKRVIIDDYVQPACMPEEPPKPGEVMFATGWGVTRSMHRKINYKNIKYIHCSHYVYV